MRKSTQLSFSVTGGGGRSDSPLIPIGAKPIQSTGSKGTSNPAADIAAGIGRAIGEGAVNAAAKHIRNRKGGGGKKDGNPNPSKGKGGKKPGGSGSNNDNNANPGGGSGGLIPGLAERRSVPVSWSSGIKSGLVVNPLQEDTSVFTPLFVLNGQFFPKFRSSDQDYNYADAVLKDFVYADYLQTLYDQHYKSGQTATMDGFLRYFDSIIEALQLYYMVDSVLTYCTENKNQNVGMMHIRRRISVEVIYYHEQLGERLSAMFIPDNLLLYIRYMYQNFSFGNTIDAPIIRLGYKGYLQDKVTGVNKYELDKTVYLRVLRSLQNGFALSSSLQKWKRDNASETLRTSLPASTSQIFYDPQFCTFWHNCNIAYKQGNEVMYTRTCHSEHDNLYYGVFAEEVDGAIFASCSVTLMETVTKETSADGELLQSEIVAKQETGIWEPHSDFGDQTANGECSSLCVYRGGIITALNIYGHRISSHSFSAPVFLNGHWSEIDGSYAGAKYVLQHTIRGTQSAVGETINALFRV